MSKKQGYRQKVGKITKQKVKNEYESFRRKANYTKKKFPELTNQINDILYSVQKPKDIKFRTEATTYEKQLKSLDSLVSSKSYTRTKQNEVMPSVEYKRMEEITRKLNATKLKELRRTNREIIKQGGDPIPESGYWENIVRGKKRIVDDYRFFQFEPEVNPYDKAFSSNKARKETIENIEKASERKVGRRAMFYHESYVKAVREQLQDDELADFISKMSSTKFSGLYYAKGGRKGDLAIGFIYDLLESSVKSDQIASLVGFKRDEE